MPKEVGHLDFVAVNKAKVMETVELLSESMLLLLVQLRAYLHIYHHHYQLKSSLFLVLYFFSPSINPS